MNPDKVVITITADGYMVEVTGDGKKISSHSTYMLSASRARTNQPGILFEDLADFEDLAEEIEEISLVVFGIASELYKINEEFSQK